MNTVLIYSLQREPRSISQYFHSFSFVFSYEKYTEPFVIFALKFVVVDPSWPASMILIHTFSVCRLFHPALWSSSC